ncbi:MAPK-activated protein kinase Srk1, partial [Linderina pennispora]
MPIFPSNIAEKQRQGDTRQKKPEGAFIPGVGAGGIGRVKLIDFGLSKVVWNQATRTPCGTTGYAAPEIVRDEMYTKSVDMWGLGCMLYAMICGFPPFYDEDVKVLTRKVAMGQYEFLSPWWDDVNPMVKHLIRNLLELDPRRRYTIDDFMNHPWIREGLEEMYGNQFLADTARASVDRRRNNIRRNATHAKLTSALSINPSGQFSPRQNMKHAYDLAYAVCRLDNDAIAHQKFAKTPAWDATFGDSLNLGPADHAMDGQHSTQRPQQPQQNHSNSVG